jgi:hypothetical protein
LVIDRPAAAELSSEHYEYWGDKIDIANDVSPGTFKYKVDTREKELLRKKRISSIPYKEMLAKGLKSAIVETDIPWLEKAVSPTLHSHLLIFKDLVDADYSFTTEGYLLAGSTMLTMKSKIGPRDSVEQSIRLTTDEYRNITYRDNWTVPTERGFCINGALMSGPSRNSEGVEQYFLLQPGRPSLFSIKMREAVDVDLDPKYSLLKGLPDLRKQLKDQGYSQYAHILREGKRKIAGMDAEEVLLSIKDGHFQAFRFYLTAPGTPGSTAQPHTDIRLSLGAEPRDGLPPDQATSPVDEAGAIQVWDTLLNSMRLRPGAM